MAVILFLPRFHAAILSGAKRQTVRAVRKRPVRPGERLSLRTWTGAPYRSKQRELCPAVCTGTDPVRLERSPHGLRVELAGVRLSALEVVAFALDDGFGGVDDMRAHWLVHRALPFEGAVIRWLPLDALEGDGDGEREAVPVPEPPPVAPGNPPEESRRVASRARKG